MRALAASGDPVVMRSFAWGGILALVLLAACGDDSPARPDAAEDAPDRDGRADVGDVGRDRDIDTGRDGDADRDADADANADADGDAFDCVDEDHDGYGDGFDCLAADCDDQDETISPEATEVCDGADNDCDNDIDPGCACTPSQTQPCGTNEGVCQEGLETCGDDGTWGLCDGDVGPAIVGDDEAAARACNGEDDDCDGDVDEGCACAEGDTRACGVDDGVCTAGTETCTDAGVYEGCTDTGPTITGDDESAEAACDDEDDDCDGDVDEGCGCAAGDTRPCGMNVGVCTTGVETCSASGVYGTCSGTPATIPLGNEASASRCNGLDDDCDATIDEGCGCAVPSSRPCGSDTGVCAEGTERCTPAGVYAGCDAIGPSISGTNEAAANACDAEDDDCDGTIDDGCLCANGNTRACGTDTGVCVAGTETCTLAGVYTGCNSTGPATSATNEASVSLCNSLDDNCDGATDEGCLCANGNTRACGTDTGVCVAGTETCTLAGVYTGCNSTGPATSATNEASVSLCNSLDDNCNGTTDEGCLCANGNTRACGTDVGVCVAGTETCTLAGVYAGCNSTGPTTGATNEASVSLCNGLDDNCNGTTDEGCACASGDTRACGTDAGVCVAGIETCTAAGVFAGCTATGPTTTNPNEASVSLCNGSDDNCNGTNDEGCGCVPPATQACGTDVGECVAGTRACLSNGTFSSTCSGETPAGPRACDGQDNDCDGVLDDTQPPCSACTAIRLTTDDGSTLRPSIVWNGTELGVAFSDSRSGNFEIYFLRLTTAGVPIGSLLRVTTAAGLSDAPKLVWNGTSWGIVFYDTRDGNEEIYFARVDALGAEIGDEIRLTNTGTTSQFPVIAWDGGGYGIVWEENPSGTNQLDFMRISSTGTVTTAAMTLISTESRDASIQWLGTFYALAWSDNRFGDTEIYFARVGTDGSKPIGEVRVTNAAGFSSFPSIAWNGATELGLAFTDARNRSSGEVFFARIDTSGVVQGTQVQLTALDGGVFSTTIAFGGGQYAIVWNDLRSSLDEIYTAVRTSGGAQVQPPTRITQGTFASGYPSVTHDGTRFDLAYYDARLGNNEIFLSQLGPDGLCL